MQTPTCSGSAWSWSDHRSRARASCRLVAGPVAGLVSFQRGHDRQPVAFFVGTGCRAHCLAVINSEARDEQQFGTPRRRAALGRLNRRSRGPSFAPAANLETLGRPRKWPDPPDPGRLATRVEGRRHPRSTENPSRLVVRVNGTDVERARCWPSRSGTTRSSTRASSQKRCCTTSLCGRCCCPRFAGPRGRNFAEDLRRRLSVKFSDPPATMRELKRYEVARDGNANKLSTHCPPP